MRVFNAQTWSYFLYCIHKNYNKCSKAGSFCMHTSRNIQPIHLFNTYYWYLYNYALDRLSTPLLELLVFPRNHAYSFSPEDTVTT